MAGTLLHVSLFRGCSSYRVARLGTLDTHTVTFWTSLCAAREVEKLRADNAAGVRLAAERSAEVRRGLAMQDNMLSCGRCYRRGAVGRSLGWVQEGGVREVAMRRRTGRESWIMKPRSTHARLGLYSREYLLIQVFQT